MNTKTTTTILEKIASRITGISIDDLTMAETQIADILVEEKICIWSSTTDNLMLR